ncbi:hypothetical protein [uncultured Planococcus sp.]|uniref:hypothetical protein n=1 Tax=Planococcus donghaensis TaxID=414778 RepID=UPI00262C044B|nr:hypothetical protein [uncultured Planococcus sp.]
MGDFIGAIFILIPIFIAAIALRWVRILRLNSEKQIQQNEEIISLLKESARGSR